MFKLTSFPINFVSSAFTLSTPAPPFPITIPGLAVYKFTFIAFAIAQFGLMAVVKKGYAYLGYAALITLFIPFVIHAVATKGKEI